MGLYATAYGKVLDLSDWNQSFYCFGYEELRKQGDYTCLHTHKSSYLRADEIIFYKDSQVTIWWSFDCVVF